MKICQTSLSEIFGDCFLRCDVKNILMRQKYDLNSFAKMSEFITFIETGKPITREDYAKESNNIHLVVRNISDGEVIYDDPVYITDEKAQELSAYRIQKNDIVIAISSNCGASFLVNDTTHYNVTLSHYLCRIRVNSDLLRPEFLVYYLNTKMMQEYFRGVETGKTQKNLSKVYINNAPVCIISPATQEEIYKQIYPLVTQKKTLINSLLHPAKIINKVFETEFGFDSNEFELLKRIKTFTSSQLAFSGNPDLRFSAKFHRNAGSFVMKQLTAITDKKIKHFLAEPIILGASISPNDYSDDGDYQYISMATIKNWMFDSESANYVSKEYSDSKVAKTVRKNDIILARSGEGTIGKVALIDDDNVNGVFADFTMRIRLKDYNPEFAYYYFRTSYFQYLIEIYKKGLGNNTNIFPIVIQDFPLIDISLDEQQRIVDEIHSEIAKQEDIKKQIADLRNQIDCIIEDAIAKGDE